MGHRTTAAVRSVGDHARKDEPHPADEMDWVTGQVRELLEGELRESGRSLMRELDEQIDRIDDLLHELRDDGMRPTIWTYRVLREARQAARDMRDQADRLPDHLESFVQWSAFDWLHALAIDVRHGLA